MCAPRYLPSSGGVEKHIQKVSEVLMKRGYEVDVLTGSHDASLKTYDVAGNQRIFRIPYHYCKNPFLAYSWILKERRLLHQYDVFHMHDPVPMLLWFLPIFLIKRGRKIAGTFHGYEQDPVPMRFKILRKVARLLLGRVLCIGDFIERVYRVKCARCRLGAVESSEQPTRERKGIVFVGRLEPDTGIESYLGALSKLAESYKIKERLTICGTGSLLKRAEQMGVQLGIDIVLKGFVEDVSEYYEKSFVCFAGGYLSILEAMSKGIPVIAIAETNLKLHYFHSINTAGGKLSIQTTPEGVAREMMKLRADANLYSRITQHNLDFARRMSWQEMANEYMVLWRK